MKGECQVEKKDGRNIMLGDSRGCDSCRDANAIRVHEGELWIDGRAHWMSLCHAFIEADGRFAHLIVFVAVLVRLKDCEKLGRCFVISAFFDHGNSQVVFVNDSLLNGHFEFVLSCFVCRTEKNVFVSFEKMW